jgi:hypothetical protein
MDGDKIEELALYMLSRLPARFDAQEDGLHHDYMRAIAAGIAYAIEMDEKNLADKVYKSLQRKSMSRSINV